MHQLSLSTSRIFFGSCVVAFHFSIVQPFPVKLPPQTTHRPPPLTRQAFSDIPHHQQQEILIGSTSKVSEIASPNATLGTRQEPPSELVALEHFLSIRSSIIENIPGGVQIISRGTTRPPSHQNTEAQVYEVISTDGDRPSPPSPVLLQSYVIAIVDSSQSVCVEKLQEGLGSETCHDRLVRLHEVDDVRLACGFSASTVPPIGHLSNGNVTIVLDQTLLDKCLSNDLFLLGNGGYSYWQTLVKPEVMLSLSNIKVLDIAEDSNNIAKRSKGQQLLEEEGNDYLQQQSPFQLCELDLPPIKIAKIITEQKELSNPLLPVFVNITGRVGAVERTGKWNAIFELLPPLVEDVNMTVTNTTARNDIIRFPWETKGGEVIAIWIQAGKPLLQKLGKPRMELALDLLMKDTVVQAIAMTNVGSRTALLSWVNEHKLEFSLTDLQCFDGDTEILLDDTLPSTSNKNNPRLQSAMSPLPFLTLSDLSESPFSVQVVNSEESLNSFASDLEILDFVFDKEEEIPLVGIDCEWQPNQLSEPDQVRPVLLMQVSLNALGKVYLFDLQSLLRPLLDLSEEMNKDEHRVCEVVARLWSNPKILKAGYQVTSDLRRVAASFPHIVGFHEIHGVLEVDQLVKRTLHITKQKKSRSITTSVARMASHYMGRTLNKTCQVSDWRARPLSDAQEKYAALDAAVAPALVEKALATINATVDRETMRIQRWGGDAGLSKAIESLRFEFFPPEGAKLPKKSRAKQIVGDNWIVTQSWIAGNKAPNNQDW